MSADKVTSVQKPDVPVTAAGQGKDASTAAGQRADAGAAGPKGQDNAAARQPATALLRQDHADAVLGGTPGRPREAPGGAAPDHQQAGKAGQAPPEHGRPGGDAGTAVAGAMGHD